jgi:hypothetical protein
MPGPDDQLADVPSADAPRLPGPDPVHPRESDPVAAELRDRMERLPPGHPSSPYNADGTRKPPPPDLSDYELPIPGDPDYQPDMPASKADPPSGDSSQRVHDPNLAVDGAPIDEEPTAVDSQADRSLDPEDAPHLGTDGSWEWKDLSLSPDQSQLADRSLGRCREVEGRDQSGSYGQRGLTPAMRQIEAQLDYSRLAPDTEKFALKGADRFKEKLAKLIQRYPGENPEQLANRIHDGIRYTFLSDTADYAAGVWEATDKLHGQGFEQIVRTNNWGAAEYKGVNTRWRDAESGLLFEVQFHTTESWDSKKRTHEAYEKINDVRTPVGEVERLRQYQREISDKIPPPPGWQTIPAYHKDDK